MTIVIIESVRGGVKKKLYFWVVPTTKWPTSPPPPVTSTSTIFLGGEIFFCFESPDTENNLTDWKVKFYCVFTRFEGFCIEWKQK